MAIGQTNITTTLVKNELSESSTSVGALCKSPLINKWSRCKPIQTHNSNESEWFKGNDNNFGLVRPVGTLSTFDMSDWLYLKPSSVFRLGDFRGYVHESTPSFFVNSFQSGTLNFSLDTTASFQAGINDYELQGITIGDLGLAGWYFGVKLTWGTNGVAFKTGTSTIGSGAVGRFAEFDMDSPTLKDVTTPFTWQSFLCESPIIQTVCLSNTIPFAVGALQIVSFPNVSTYPNSGTFSIWRPVRNNCGITIASGETMTATGTCYADDDSTSFHASFTPSNLGGTTLLYYRITGHLQSMSSGQISGCSNGVQKNIVLTLSSPMSSLYYPLLFTISTNPV